MDILIIGTEFHFDDCLVVAAADLMVNRTRTFICLATQIEIIVSQVLCRTKAEIALYRLLLLTIRCILDLNPTFVVFHPIFENHGGLYSSIQTGDWPNNAKYS